MPDYLFSSGDLRAALGGQAAKMRQAVEAEPEENLKQADPDEWARALAHHFAVACPELKRDEIWMEPVEDIGVDVSRDQMRAIFDPYSDAVRNYPGHRVVVHIPFEGEADVFKFTPSTRTYSSPLAEVRGRELIKRIEYPHDRPANIDAEVNELLRQVDAWLAWAKSDIDSFNASLVNEAAREIGVRRQRIEQRDAHLAQSSIPVRRPGESGKKTYIPDVLVRRPAPSLPQTRADDKPPQLEPVLEERVFEHILGVIRMQARQMEQNPDAYKGMGEEDRRHTLVATLNTHYEGRAAAEAFNYSGKTDILIRHDGGNLFICECKFWSGQESFKETIDQLFRYVSWRDSKLAIVLFVREKGLSAILEKARETLSAHPQFAAWKDASEETELRATMHWPGDEERMADLNVFFIHTPQLKK